MDEEKKLPLEDASLYLFRNCIYFIGMKDIVVEYRHIYTKKEFKIALLWIKIQSIMNIITLIRHLFASIHLIHISRASHKLEAAEISNICKKIGYPYCSSDLLPFLVIVVQIFILFLIISIVTTNSPFSISVRVSKCEFYGYMLNASNAKKSSLKKLAFKNVQTNKQNLNVTMKKVALPIDKKKTME